MSKLRNFILRLLRLDSSAMAFLYASEFIASLGYLYSATFVYHIIESDLLLVLRGFACGVCLILDLWCIIWAVHGKASLRRAPVLIALTTMQVLHIGILIGLVAQGHSFWSLYIFFLYRLSLIVSYTRRYCFLQRTKDLVFEETEAAHE